MDLGIERLAVDRPALAAELLDEPALGSGQQFELGRQVRALLADRGFPSVAAAGFEAPGVVVSYTTDPEVQNGKKFIAQGVQSAAGVPLMCDEPAGFSTFRLGLFGLDKWAHVERSVGQLAAALDRMGYPARATAAA